MMGSVRQWLTGRFAPRPTKVALPRQEISVERPPYVCADPVAGASDSLLIMADALGPTQQISFLSPLAMRRLAGELSIAVLTEATLETQTYRTIASLLDTIWHDRCPTAVIVSRAATRHIGAISAKCRSTGTPLIVHLDDDLFAVPDELGASKAARHNDPARLARLAIACRRADGLYASTSNLAASLQQRFPDALIWPGEIYASAKPPFTPFTPTMPVTFGYMGTAGHVADLEEIVPAIAQVLDLFPDARFETFGTIKPPASLSRFGGRIRAIGPAETYDRFMAKLRTLGWTAGLAPVRASPFNLCKADTKFVEYAQAGIPAILAAHEVYQHPLGAKAALGASNIDEWREALVTLITKLDYCRQLVDEAHLLLAHRYSAERHERQIMAVLGAVRRQPEPRSSGAPSVALVGAGMSGQ